MPSFDFHGTRVTVGGDAAAVQEQVARDFSLFVRPRLDGAPHVSLDIWNRPPPWELAPAGARAVMVKPNCVVYDAGGERWVDYQGKALCRWRYADERGDLWTEDAALAHEITYLLVCSRMGERHDQQGLHRVHALGLVAPGGGGILCLLPSGGGKTTLGLTALRDTGASLLSDDTPLIDRRGDLYGFPIRVGVVGEPPLPVDPRHLRSFERTEHGPKVLIDADAFADRVAWRAEPRAVIIGERTLAGRASLTPMPAHRAAPELFRGVVVGVGLPQVVEYFLRFDVADAVRKGKIVASRALACAALLRRARSYRFVLGRDRAENGALLHELIRGLA